MRLDYHHLYRLWELLITTIMAFVAIAVPAHFVLEYDIFDSPVVYWLITLMLCVDMFVQRYHMVPQLVSPAENSHQRALAPNMGWLIVDLVAVIPFRLLPGGALFELLRLLKLVRIAQLMGRWRRQSVQHAQILRLVFFVCWLLIIAHWLACGWLAIGGIDMEADEFSKYLRSLYWCITTLATVGYGDIVPKTNLQTVYAMVVMLLGVGVYGYVIGNVTNLVANIDLAKTHYRENMERLAALCGIATFLPRCSGAYAITTPTSGRTTWDTMSPLSWQICLTVCVPRWRCSSDVTLLSMLPCFREQVMNSCVKWPCSCALWSSPQVTLSFGPGNTATTCTSSVVGR